MDECETWKLKYDRLVDSYTRLQRAHRHTENRLLRSVDNYDAERAAARHDIATLSSHLMAARAEIARLRCVNENYNRDLRLAVDLLQCHPTTYVDRKIDSLPTDIRHRLYGGLRRVRPATDPAAFVTAAGEYTSTLSRTVGMSCSSSLSSLSSLSCALPSSALATAGTVGVTSHAFSHESPLDDELVGGECVTADTLACVLERRRQQLALSSSLASAGRHQRALALCRRVVDVAVQTSPPLTSVSFTRRPPLSVSFPYEPPATPQSPQSPSTAPASSLLDRQCTTDLHLLQPPLQPCLVIQSSAAAAAAVTDPAVNLTDPAAAVTDPSAAVLTDGETISAVSRLLRELPSRLLIDSVDMLPPETRV